MSLPGLIAKNVTERRFSLKLARKFATRRCFLFGLTRTIVYHSDVIF
jgi:hypothetical protein